MRFAAAVLVLAVLLVVPLAGGESVGRPRLTAAGGTAWPTWGVAGAQFEDGTAIGVRYWQNMTASGGPVTVFATVCLRLDSGAGVCDRYDLQS